MSLKEKKMQHVLKRKHIHFDGFQVFDRSESNDMHIEK